MHSNLEKEVKLLGGYNNQLKYSDNSIKDTLNKIELLLETLDIKHDEMKEKFQKDTYFDTQDLKIKKKEGSARIRAVYKNGEKKYFMTIKTKNEEGAPLLQDSLNRNEAEAELSSEDESELIKKIRHTFKIAEDTEIFRQIQVSNRRHYCSITTDIATYELAYDKFTYTDMLDASESPDYYEIEIELNRDDAQQHHYADDKKIAMFSKLLKQVLGFEHDKKSKYSRGMEWRNNRNHLISKNFVVFDIVGYSKEYSYEQKKKVEKFTEIINRCLNVLNNVEIIPMGDGMILIAPDTVNIIPFLSVVFENLRVLNRNRCTKEQIKIRTALHIGSVMTYIDINGNKNYAGHGINTAYRINNAADVGQVLVSEEFYQNMKHRGYLEEDNYKKLQPIKVKHGVVLQIYNYYDDNLAVGKKNN